MNSLVYRPTRTSERSGATGCLPPVPRQPSSARVPRTEPAAPRTPPPGRVGRLIAVIVVLFALPTSAQEPMPGRSDPTPEQINAAIDRGVAYLRSMQDEKGIWTYQTQTHTLGMTALAGLALFESEVPRDDPAIRRAESFVRAHADESLQTYDIALAIMFLAKLHPNDQGEVRDLIRRLGWRLAGGENNGMWNYTVPYRPSFPMPIVNRRAPEPVRSAQPTVPSGTTEEPGLRAGRPEGLPAREPQGVAAQEPQGVPAAGPPDAQAEDPDPAPAAAAKPASKLGPRPTPRPSTRRNSRTTRRNALPPGFPPMMQFSSGDHSNTQFGMLGLWTAGRYGYDTAPHLERIEDHFHAVQLGDGSWGYRSGMMARGPESMTCVGLLALYLAAGRDDAGDAEEALERGRELENDPSFRRGLEALSHFARRIDGASDIYFLWSLERVCVALGKEKLDGLDWYMAGARVLLDTQAFDGSWTSQSGAGPDTALALLFLHRSNLATGIEEQVRLPSFKAIAGLPYRVHNPEEMTPAEPEPPAAATPEPTPEPPATEPAAEHQAEAPAAIHDAANDSATAPVTERAGRATPAAPSGLIGGLPSDPRSHLIVILVLIGLLALPALGARLGS